jgi:Cu/Ag efflux protein CusF
MRVLVGKPLILVLALVIALALPACDGGSSEDHPGHGVVVRVDPGARKITLDHGEIPGLMMGMTMTFDLDPDATLEGVAAGVEVDFRAKEEGGAYIVTELRASGS